MKLASLVGMVRLSLARDRRGTLSSAFGIAVGVGALVFFVGLGLGVGRVVRERVFPVDARLVEVVPPRVSLGALLGGGRLDQETVDRLARLPGVERVFRKMAVRVPAVSRYDGDFFGARLRMGVELVAVGVDPGLVEGDVSVGAFADSGPGQPIPAVAAHRLLELYNKSFAPVRKLPQLSARMVSGFIFPVEFNRSYVTSSASGPVTRAQVQLVGVSDRGLLAGVTIPLATAVRLNREAGVEDSLFSGATLQARDPSEVPRLVAAARGMGLEVDDQERRMAENAGAAVALTTSALALLSLLICVLAAVNIAHALSAAVRARARDIGVLRAVGASRADVRSLVLAEAGALGLIGGAVGTVAAVGLSVLVDWASGRYLPEFPFKPDSYFAFPVAVVLGGVVLGVVAAVAGALGPARRAAGTDPARVLAG
ncbi:MAG: ABC transporter permease [Myxococcaceae bacterium]|nr:ABC transporter permease [Myxococcaceae bacterium]MCI0672354.1 ABC transporter permease [Myxococcaceae bacterium]